MSVYFCLTIIVVFSFVYIVFKNVSCIPLDIAKILERMFTLLFDLFVNKLKIKKTTTK